jgi:hypothetical protein
MKRVRPVMYYVRITMILMFRPTTCLVGLSIVMSSSYVFMCSFQSYFSYFGKFLSVAVGFVWISRVAWPCNVEGQAYPPYHFIFTGKSPALSEAVHHPDLSQPLTSSPAVCRPLQRWHFHLFSGSIPIWLDDHQSRRITITQTTYGIRNER